MDSIRRSQGELENVANSVTTSLDTLGTLGTQVGTRIDSTVAEVQEDLLAAISDAGLEVARITTLYKDKYKHLHLPLPLIPPNLSLSEVAVRSEEFGRQLHRFIVEDLIDDETHTLSKKYWRTLVMISLQACILSSRKMTGHHDIRFSQNFGSYARYVGPPL